MADAAIDFLSFESGESSFGVSEKYIAFEHRVFSVFKSSYFRMSEDQDDPVLVIYLSDNELVLPFKGIFQEFEIDPDTRDGRMLNTIAESLSFVRHLRIGDPIPEEVLTGEASWEATPQSRKVAYHRLAMNLISWVTGEETILFTSEDVELLADDPEHKDKIKRAFLHASNVLGYGPNGQDQVIEQFGLLADDAAHIEALRDQFQGVKLIRDKVKLLTKLYGNEHTTLELVLPVARLAGLAVDEYQEFLDTADAYTDEVMAALRNIESYRTALREIRNDLYRRLMAWEPIFEDWNRLSLKRSAKTEALLRKTYRFLAPRFMPRDEWVLMSKLIASSKNQGDEDDEDSSWHFDDEID